MLDNGHQAFLGNQFAKIGDSDRFLTAKLVYSSVPVAIMISLVGLFIAFTMVASRSLSWLFGFDLAEHHHLMEQAGVALIFQIAVWLVFSSVSGIAVRALIPFGHYARLTWWGIAFSVVTSILPAVAVVHGATLLQATIVQGLATCLICIPTFVDLWYLMKRERILPVWPDLDMGFANFWKSLIVTASACLDIVRLQGVRLILSPVVGVANMAAFVTMRTGASFAVHGLGTVTKPLMPELMRFLRLRDQARTEAAFGFVWLMIVLAMCPSIIFLQWFASPLFEAWTRGKIHFDPMLFAVLSTGVLIYAIAQPAVAVVQGNNLLQSQLAVSLLTGCTVIAAILLLVPAMGIVGAGIALLAGEGISLFLYVFLASFWLKSNSMRWPIRQFATVVVCVVVTCTTLARIAIYPHEGPITIAIALAMDLGLAVFYWSQLPKLVRSKASHLAAHFLPLGFRHQRQSDW
jgi:O-antigen/teichoic acid export membrane protein